MRLKQFLTGESGAAAVYFALVSPVLIGFAALGAEATLWLVTERKLQHIADASAFSGAVRAVSSTNVAVVTAAATDSALQSGLRAADPITVHMPPVSGAHAGQAGNVEVIVERSVQRYVTGFFTGTQEPVVISARAVAGQQDGSGEPVCMLALSQAASTAFTVGGAGTVNVTGCAFASNSSAADSFDMVGAKVQVSGSCLYTVGGADVSDNLTLYDCDKPQTMQRPTPDPYADLVIPNSLAFSGLVRRDRNSVGATFNPPEYLLQYPDLPVALFDGMDLKGTVTFGRGLYVIDGGTLKVNAGAQISGTGVSFLLLNGAKLDVSGSAVMTVSAYDPSNPALRSDPFAGLLFFADREGVAVSHSLSGNSGNDTNGVIYLPNDSLTYIGNSGSSYPCLEIIASKLAVSGSGTLNIGCRPDVPPGRPPMVAASRLALKE